MAQRKATALATAKAKTSQTPPSRIGTNIIERFTSKVVLTMLLMLLVYSIFFDIPQVNLRDKLYLMQLDSLVVMANRTNSTSSEAFGAVLSVLVKDPNAPRAVSNFPVATYVKIAGVEVYNLSRSLNLSYSVVDRRRPVELLYTRLHCNATYTGAAVGGSGCVHVIVHDRQRELFDEVRDQFLVTLLMVVIIGLCIGLMALDMQLMLNPLERMTKLFKILSGRRWRKKMERARQAGEEKEWSISRGLEDFETEAYFALRLANLFFLDVEEAFSIRMGKWRQKLWTFEVWFDKIMLFVNRLLAHASTATVTVDELYAQIISLASIELPVLFRKLTDGKRLPSRLVSMLRYWHMTKRPRAWLANSARAALIKEMRATLGCTPTINTNQIAISELRKYIEIKLSKVLRRDLLRFGRLGLPTGTSRMSLSQLWQLARNALTTIALGKLSSNGVELAAPTHAHGEPSTSLVDMMLTSLVETSALEGLPASSSPSIKSLTEWVRATERGLRESYR